MLKTRQRVAHRPPATPDEKTALRPAQSPPGTNSDSAGNGGAHRQWMLLEPVDATQYGVTGGENTAQGIGFARQRLPLAGDANPERATSGSKFK